MRRVVPTAGRRSIAIPDFLVAEFANHMERYTRLELDSFVFIGMTGIPLTANVLQTAWQRARIKVGRPDLRLHDLRHTGLTLAAANGATTVELMHRAGHFSSVAAMRYEHASKDRDRVIANALGELARPSPRTSPS